MNRYEKIRKIGEGAFGKAYLMKEKATGNQVVVKETNLSKLPPKEREDARRETAVLAQLKHPAIVTYYDSFEEIGNLYIVMDYCDGGDLAAKINGQHGRLFSEDEILDWVAQLCLAVKHIHDRNILHRDIKCQNIFLNRAGQIKLGDFGIAKILDSTVQLSHTLIGTPYYFSPEICMGRPYNHKSDIWSLGCVFYELATLRHAFDGGNLRAVMQKIQNGTPPPISRTYSPDLHLFISSILKKNPRDRPSVSTLLQRPIVNRRINKFLSEEQMAVEFSHTVLHGERLMKQLPRGGAGRGANGMNARRPQSAQTPQARANLAAGAPANNNNNNHPAGRGQRPSTAAEGNRQQQQHHFVAPPRNEDSAAVRALPDSSDSDSYHDPYMFNMPAVPANRTPRQDQAGAVGAPGQPNPNDPARVPVFRPLPFPVGSGRDRGNYQNYLEFLRNLDVRRHQPPVVDPAHVLAPQPMNAQRPPSQQPAPAPQPQQPTPAGRPSTAAPQPGRINVVNAGLAKQLVQQNQQPQNNNVAINKRPASSNVLAGGAHAVENKRAFVRPMKNSNIPPSNKRPPIISRDQMVFDRLQRIRQSNIRSRNAVLSAVQAGKKPVVAARPPSSAGNRQPASRQPSADDHRRLQQQPQAPVQQTPPSHNSIVNPNLTDALRIIQVPGIPASPRVPPSVTPAVTPRLTDALKAVAPRQPEQQVPVAAPAVANNLHIDQQQLKKLRQAELQKANANPPIIINDRPFWLPNQSIQDDLASLTPEMTGSKMVATVEKQEKPVPETPRRKQWSTPNQAVKSEDKNDDGNDTHLVSKSPQQKQQQRPLWTASPQSRNALENSAALLSTKDSSSVVAKLATGQFDVSDFKLLRTCSLPSLAGDEISPAASTVSTLEMVRCSTPDDNSCHILTISELNRTLEYSTSTPDLLFAAIASPSLAVESHDNVETLKPEEIETKPVPVKHENGNAKLKLAWLKEDSSVEKAKKEPLKTPVASTNIQRRTRPARNRQSSKNKNFQLLSIVTTKDDDVDNVSKSMLNVLFSVSPLPQENDDKLADFKVAVDVNNCKQVTQNAPSSPKNGESKKVEPMSTLIEQLTLQTGSMTSSVSSTDGGVLGGGNTDVSKLLEELSKINGPDSPPLVNGEAAGKGSNNNHAKLNAIEALVGDSTLLDTMTSISFK